MWTSSYTYDLRRSVPFSAFHGSLICTLAVTGYSWLTSAPSHGNPGRSLRLRTGRGHRTRNARTRNHVGVLCATRGSTAQRISADESLTEGRGRASVIRIREALRGCFYNPELNGFTALRLYKAPLVNLYGDSAAKLPQPAHVQVKDPRISTAVPGPRRDREIDFRSTIRNSSPCQHKRRDTGCRTLRGCRGMR